MKNSSAVIIPTMQYHDANKAVIWLCEVFGFQPKMVYKDDDENVQHALPDELQACQQARWVVQVQLMLGAETTEHQRLALLEVFAGALSC